MSEPNALFGPAFRAAVLTDDLALAVTGVGSWLGQALLANLLAEKLVPRRLRLFGQNERRLRLGGREFVVEALSAAPPLKGGPWLLMHYAFLGKERSVDLDRATFVAANANILQQVLRIATPAFGLRFVFASSGAAYQTDRMEPNDGVVNPYGWCKAVQEGAIEGWCCSRCVPLVIPRIFNVGGAFINKIESYALSSMVLSAWKDRRIAIAARRPVFRSYVHVGELNALLCESALRQPAGRVLRFDTAGLETIEMLDLAAAIAAVLPEVEIYVESPDRSSGQPDWYVGDGRVYRKLLASIDRTIIPLETIISDTAAFLAR